MTFTSCKMFFDDIEIIEIRKTKITKITPTHADIVIIAKLSNPNSFPIKIKDSNLSVDIDGQHVGKAKVSKTFVILSDTAKFYQIGIRTEFTEEFSKGLTKFVDKAMREPIEAHVSGSLTGEAYIFTMDEPIDITQRVTF